MAEHGTVDYDVLYDRMTGDIAEATKGLMVGGLTWAELAQLHIEVVSDD